MSIATLKKKSQTQYRNMSVGQQGFSLNGTHRSQGYVGQTSLSRSLPRTLAKGNTIRGHGGCCGTYPVYPAILSAVNSTEDNSVVKKSTLSNKGMLDTKYRWIRRPQPFSNVGMKQVDQTDYLKYLKQKNIQENISKSEDSLCKHIETDNCNASKCKYVSSKASQMIHKPKSDYLAISQEEHIQNINSRCTILDKSSIFSPRTPSISGVAFGTCS
jgi:hypothetical protein